MSRNAQVVRQRLLLERLERSKGASIDELVESLPPDYPRNPRTIRRDLEALEMRFPLLTERRAGKTVWRRMDGYAHSLRLTFSQTELMALVFSKDLLRALDGTEPTHGRTQPPFPRSSECGPIEARVATS